MHRIHFHPLVPPQPFWLVLAVLSLIVILLSVSGLPERQEEWQFVEQLLPFAYLVFPAWFFSQYRHRNYVAYAPTSMAVRLGYGLGKTIRYNDLKQLTLSGNRLRVEHHLHSNFELDLSDLDAQDRAELLDRIESGSGRRLAVSGG